jgi:adenine/guanine phosphoribosyltransferase-like PRPP-binding protein
VTDTKRDGFNFLETEFLRDAKVIDAVRGYISVSSFNVRMKPQILKNAAALIAREFADVPLNIVHGIPHSGNYLATAVSIEMDRNIRLHASRKDQFIPATWKDVYREEVRSFTTSGNDFTVFSGINFSFVQKGDRILLIDDVCATGETGYQIIEGLRKRGVTVVGFAVLFDKIFQGGLDHIATLGVRTFSCIRVEKIEAGDKVTLANPAPLV